MAEQERADFDLPPSLGWLMDASLFIDSDIIDRFYDAVLRPLHKEGKRTISLREHAVKKLAGKLAIDAKIEPSASDLLGKLVSSIADVRLGGEAAVESIAENQAAKNTSIDLEPIHTPHRRLEQLTLHYLVNHTDRIFLEHETASSDEWKDPKTILDTPRALAFFDFPGEIEAEQNELPKTAMIPAAAEFQNGEIVPIYQQLKFDRWVPPEYPELGRGNIATLEGLQEARKEYWADFASNYSATASMVAVEKVVHPSFCNFD